MEYSEEDYLQISGLQHFKFCRRQWALIHIESLWAENCRTIDGAQMHENAHNRESRESRGDLLIVRALDVFSPSLGVSGQCDVVEFRRSADGVTLKQRDGRWLPYPVEYKRGQYNERSGDMLQLCAQAMCLEEMLCCSVPKGALFYGEPRRRLEVAFTDELRQTVRDSLAEMHDYYRRGYTPKVKPTKSCNACSLRELCMPRLMSARPVAGYLAEAMEDD